MDDSADTLVLGLGSTLGTTPAMTVNSSQVVTFAQNPVFPDGGVAVADLDIDGATDIGAAIVDADLFIVDDGAGGTNRKATASRVKTYMQGSLVLIEAQKTYQSAASALDFEDVFTDTYDLYVIDVIGFRPTTADRFLQFRFRTSAGIISDSDYSYAITSLDEDGNAGTRLSTGDTQGYFSQTGTENSASGFFRAYVPRPQGMGNQKYRLFGHGTNIQNSGSDITTDRFANFLDQTAAITGIYFFGSGSTEIYGCQIKIYGVL